MKKLFNNDWEFQKTDVELSLDNLKENSWKRVDIPHDWLIHQTKDLYETSAGWYRKKIGRASCRERV